MDEVTFDGISECYDASREVPLKVIQQLVGCLEEVGVFQGRQVLVDVACGTAGISSHSPPYLHMRSDLTYQKR